MQFKDKDLEKFWEEPTGTPPKRVPPELRRILYRKLKMLDAAKIPRDLWVPPNNRLEKLRGSREGQYSVRVNDKWRLCFIWTDGEAKEVEFCDYH